MVGSCYGMSESRAQRNTIGRHTWKTFPWAPHGNGPTQAADWYVGTATQIATQLFGIGWQQAASSGTAGRKTQTNQALWSPPKPCWDPCNAFLNRRSQVRGPLSFSAPVHSGSRLRSHPVPVLIKLSPFTQRSPMGSMVIESTAPTLGLSASAIAAFLASSTVLKSPAYVASKAGGMPGARGLAK